MKKKPSAARGLLTLLLAVLAIAAIILLTAVLEKNAEVQRVRALTPTPLPEYGSVFRVTPDPRLPTAEPVMRSGATGAAVTKLQERLRELGYYTAMVDGQFGPGTKAAVTLFQQNNGLAADGVVGPETNEVLYSSAARPASTPAPTAAPSPTADTTSVSAIQQRLKDLGYYKGTVDGISGPNTKSAITAFQKQNGLKSDGICGPATSALLFSDRAQPVQLTPTPDPAAIPGLMSNGYPILVNRDNYIPDQYQPLHLVRMRDVCDASVVTIKGSEIEGEKVAVDALMTMLRAAQAAGLKKWQVNSGYRSVRYQQQLFDNKVKGYMNEGLTTTQARAKARQTVADPGASEHHTGLAFDLAVTGEASFAATKQSTWLSQHCWEYGFILRYPADKTDITKFSEEPWHIRYVGTAHSLIMRDENLCLEEYIAKYAQ